MSVSIGGFLKAVRQLHKFPKDPGRGRAGPSVWMGKYLFFGNLIFLNAL